MSDLNVRIIGTDLPGIRCNDREPVYVDLEHGKEGEGAVRADAGKAVFAFTVRFVDNDFRGPYVTGKRGERFIRLRWGVLDGDEWIGFARTKIHLSGQEEFAGAALDSGGTLEATLGLTGRKGGPAVASIPPDQISWRVA